MGTFLTGVGAVIFVGLDTANGLNFLKLFFSFKYLSNKSLSNRCTLFYTYNLSFSQHSSVKVKFLSSEDTIIFT